MGKARSLLRGFAAGGGSGGGDFWKPPKDGGKVYVRLFRFTDADGDLDLFAKRFVHWKVLPKGPMTCTGPSCEPCKLIARLKASGTDDDRKKAANIKQKSSAVFAIIPLDDPTAFKMWDAPITAAQGVFSQIAKAGGRMGNDYPSMKASEEEWVTFEECFEAGIDKVCGPEGRDIYIVYNPKAAPANMYSVDMRIDGNKILPFSEDDDENPVINPPQVLLRMEEAANKPKDD